MSVLQRGTGLVLALLLVGSGLGVAIFGQTITGGSPEAVCNRGDILVCEDWEGDPLGKPGWGVANSEYSSWGGGIVSSPVVGGSSRSIELLVKQGIVDSIFPATRIAEQQGPVYLRWIARWEPGYVWNENITKHMYLMSWDAQANLLWRVPLHMKPQNSQRTIAKPVFQLYCNMTNYPDSQCVGGEKWFFQNIGTAIDIVPGNWYSFEMMVKPDNIGQAYSGALRLWINGELKMDYTGVSLRHTSITSPLNGIELSSYYGGGGSVAPKNLRVWYDNIVASKSYIGPPAGWGGGGSAAPTAPSNLRIVSE